MKKLYVKTRLFVLFLVAVFSAAALFYILKITKSPKLKTTTKKEVASTAINNKQLVTDERIKLFWHLFKHKKWNTLFFVFVEADRVQHILWEDIELLKYWIRLDQFLDDVINEIEKHGNITLMIVDNLFDDR